MKKHLSLSFAAMCALTMLNAQNIVPNGSFENWNSTSYELPTNYPVSSVTESFHRGIAPNVEKTTDAYHGQYAVKLTTIQSSSGTVGAWIATSSDSEGNDPSSWGGGIAYNQIPTGIKGYYKYNVDFTDFALIGVVFKKNGASYAHYYYPVGGNHSSYTPFEFTFTPALTQAPDSIIFVATSSNLLISNGSQGSILILDNVSLTGVASQPDQLNGDFEAWTNHTSNVKPEGWNTYDAETGGIFRTTDAYVGNYALELVTYLGRNENKLPIAQNGWIQIGKYINESTFLGGFPFNNTQEKLAFYYKYAPQNPNDKANINIIAKRNGISIGGNSLQLTASPTYKYMELNINTRNGLAPDSAYIAISSSDWQNMDLSYVGASLKIDGLVFKTITTDTPNANSNDLSIGIYPNPISTSGILEIQSVSDLSGITLNIYSADGKPVKQIVVHSSKTTIDKGDYPSGLYYWDVVKENVSLKKGKFIIL